MILLDWTHMPKGQPDCNGNPISFDFHSAVVATAADPRGIGVVNACNHGHGWTASASLYGLDCDSKEMAEAVAEHAARLLLQLRDDLSKCIVALRDPSTADAGLAALARMDAAADLAAAVASEDGSDAAAVAEALDRS